MDPDLKQIQEWKKRSKVYRTRIGGQLFYFRPMTIGEFRRISLTDNMSEKQEIILKNGVLSPKILDLNQVLSGVGETLVADITNVTNITEETTVKKVSEARDKLGITDNILSLQIEIIKNLNYTPERVDSMTFDEFVDAVVLVEAMIGRSLIAGGVEENPQPRAQEDVSSDRSSPVPIELTDMKDIRQHEAVANENAERLRRAFNRKRRLMSGRTF